MHSSPPPRRSWRRGLRATVTAPSLAPHVGERRGSNDAGNPAKWLTGRGGSDRQVFYFALSLVALSLTFSSLALVRSALRELRLAVVRAQHASERGRRRRM